MTSDEQKFLDFYDKNITRIYRYVYFRVGSQEAAQDLSSEAFAKTWQYIKDGSRPVENLSALIYQICRNLIADYFRDNAARPMPLEEAVDAMPGEMSDDSASIIVKKADDCLRLDRVRQCLRFIRPEYQELIIWYYIDDFEVSEIAQILGRTEGAIRTALSRAISALKRRLNVKDKDC